MTHFISESTVHEYQYSIEHFPETSSLMTSGCGTNYDFSICSRSPHSSLSLKELQTSFPDAPSHSMLQLCTFALTLTQLPAIIITTTSLPIQLDATALLSSSSYAHAPMH